MKKIFLRTIFNITKPKQYVKDKECISLKNKIVKYIKFEGLECKKSACNIWIFRGILVKMLEILKIFI